jgi:hypothetical protein
VDRPFVDEFVSRVWFVGLVVVGLMTLIDLIAVIVLVARR